METASWGASEAMCAAYDVESQGDSDVIVSALRLVGRQFLMVDVRDKVLSLSAKHLRQLLRCGFPPAYQGFPL